MAGHYSAGRNMHRAGVEDAHGLPGLDGAGSGGAYARQRVAPARTPHTRPYAAAYKPRQERVWPAERGVGGLVPFLVWRPGAAAVSRSDWRASQSITRHAPRRFRRTDPDTDRPGHYAGLAAYSHLRC